MTIYISEIGWELALKRVEGAVCALPPNLHVMVRVRLHF